MTFNGHLIQNPCKDLQLDQVAESPVQPDLECLQGWGIYNFSGQSLPVFYHLHSTKTSFFSNLNKLLFSLKPVPTGPVKIFVLILSYRLSPREGVPS